MRKLSALVCMTWRSMTLLAVSVFSFHISHADNDTLKTFSSLQANILNCTTAEGSFITNEHSPGNLFGTRDFSSITITAAGAPANGILGCNPTSAAIDASLGFATASSDCGAVNVTVSDGAVINSNCLRVQTRMFTATDDCGNTVTTSRTVTWTQDLTPPTLIVAGDASVECNPTPAAIDAALGSATATDACGTPIVTVTIGPVNSNGCVRFQTRTWTATDACGNTATASRTVSWTEDFIAPTIVVQNIPLATTCNPSARAIENALGFPLGLDNCSAPTLVTTEGAIKSSGCSRTQTRIFRASDDCGNTTIASTTVTWTVNLSPPEITVTNTPITTCNPSVAAIEAALGFATATSECGTPTLTSATGPTGTFGCSRSQTRVFTATDGCGNTASAFRVATWTVDLSPPTINVTTTPLATTCNPSPSQINAALGFALAIDNCSPPVITVTDGVIQSSGCSRTQTRTFTVSDACDNTATATRTVTWTTNTFSVTGTDLNLGCNPSFAAINEALGSATVISDCGTATVTMTDGAIISSGCSRAQTRVFNASDACGNMATTTRTATWTVDLSSPVLTVVGTSLPTTCNPSSAQINAALGFAVATDNCSTPIITTTDGVVQSSACLRSQTRIFTATDACGNTTTAARTVVWTSEVTPPVFTGDYSTIELGCNPFPFRISRLLGNATATDACSSVTITQTDGVVQSKGCRSSLTRFFTATDGCGNIATISRTVQWTSDFIPPTFTGDYSNVPIGCNPTALAINSALGSATAIDACTSVTITQTDGVVQSSGCNRTQTRFFTATDGCGNIATTLRTSTWTEDVTSPLIAAFGAPANGVLGCNPAPASIEAALGSAIATDACVTTTVTSSTGAVQSSACLRSQIRTFTATDACGNTTTAARTVVWTSEVTPPVFTGDYSTIELGCNPFPFRISRLLGNATATDACSSVTITQTDGVVQSKGCRNSLTRFFTATDGCGNIATISRTVQWTSDFTPPTFTGDYSNVSIGCNPTALAINSALGSATAIDACTSVTITQTDGVVQSSGCNRTATRFFTATDVCGNIATTSRTSTWTEDVTSPFIAAFGAPGNGVAGCNPAPAAIEAALGSAIATDACVTTTVTSSTGAVQSSGCLRSQTRTFTATDACGNTATTARTVVWTSEVTPPVFTGDYSTIELGCNPSPFRISRLLGNATATDACSSVTITQTDGVVQSKGCRNSLTRFFTATDGCGNIATTSRTAVWETDGCCAFITSNKSFQTEVETPTETKLIVKNPQYKNERLTFYGIGPGKFDVVLINSQGQVVANLKKYQNDWPLSKLTPGLYFYTVQYKNENGELKRIAGKVVISN